MYLGSPRMVEMVVREQTTLEEMGGARMHCTVSGCGHYLRRGRADALEAVRRLPVLPAVELAAAAAGGAAAPAGRRPTCARWCPASERQAYDMRRYLRGLVDAGRCSRSTRCGRAS